LCIALSARLCEDDLAGQVIATVHNSHLDAVSSIAGCIASVARDQRPANPS
jgi:hypothetical protein